MDQKRRGRRLSEAEAKKMSRRATLRQRVDKLIANMPIRWPRKNTLSFEDAAKILNWSRQSVYHAALRTREIPFREVEGRYFICTQDLLTFIDRIIAEEKEEVEKEMQEVGSELVNGNEPPAPDTETSTGGGESGV